MVDKLKDALWLIERFDLKKVLSVDVSIFRHSSIHLEDPKELDKLKGYEIKTDRRVMLYNRYEHYVQVGEFKIFALTEGDGNNE